MVVDASFGYCFVMDGKLVRASEVYRNERYRKHFAPIYQQMCEDIGKVLSFMDTKTFAACVPGSPLEGFREVGYHNYYLL